ncbi:type II toxin-antitoxin system VapC family toxin [Synechococcus sp. EJ6-Ellesmere]|uniref:type II toxin-antitoxin system VapC family toxin n=1 Tax=Synechococcus sp. EJ6-Ellesmere TaxID=2823734 RepID=UPI0020CD9762|nr:type II toxin-antitoxin system VapC family toxin [Synechococcus sp. EJ6-Ellesmere]MCP9825159.1 type II toxin-antitoxin system VapC family toxin [Synechococcus sp. EJ6-Ellesmere]
MDLLLDTHLVVWAMGSPQRLPPGLAEMLEDPRHTPVFSVASLWELVIKQGLGRPDFNVQPAVLRRALLEGNWQELAIETRHALAVAQLPPLHRDPFDRLLLAQATVDGLLLITADSQLAAYPGPVRFMAAAAT